MIILIIGAAMIPPLIVSLLFREYETARAFALAAGAMLPVGAATVCFVKPLNTSLRTRDGILVVSLCWLLASALGTAPYIFSGVLPSFIDAFFESASGFSTTGATLIENLYLIPKGLLFWRSFSHWLGGMGILVFVISIFPALGISAQNIVKAETPGPTLDKITTKISDNAKILYLIYISLSVVELILLSLGKMNLFDAIIHTFSSMGTGGLSNYAGGITSFNSVFVEVVISLFCLLASINFANYNDLLHRRWKELFKEPELRAFLLIMFVSAFLIAIVLVVSGTYESAPAALGQGFFHVISFMSTSGYVGADYSIWPAFCQWILFTLLFVGGCSASAAGGIKVIRVAVMCSLIRRNFFRQLHPRAVVPVKIGGKLLSSENVSNITVFIAAYTMVFFIGSLILALDNQDLLTTVSAAAAAVSNTGIGFGSVAAGEPFIVFSPFSRLFLSLLMIAGRLELFTIIILLTPYYWFPDK
jgi:trk system potassium uptake protein TrkH